MMVIITTTDIIKTIISITITIIIIVDIIKAIMNELTVPID